MEGNELRVLVLRAPWKFMSVFAVIFLPTFVFIAWYFIPQPSTRWLFMIAGPICGAVAFGLIFWLQSYHESLGDYLIVNRAEQTVSLPRSKRQFQFAQVIGFQRIRGRTKDDNEVHVDFNLLTIEANETVRHYIMSNPSRRLLDQVTAFTGFNLEQLDLGRRGLRDADKCHVGK